MFEIYLPGSVDNVQEQKMEAGVNVDFRITNEGIIENCYNPCWTSYTNKIVQNNRIILIVKQYSGIKRFSAHLNFLYKEDCIWNATHLFESERSRSDVKIVSSQSIRSNRILQYRYLIMALQTERYLGGIKMNHGMAFIMESNEIGFWNPRHGRFE